MHIVNADKCSCWTYMCTFFCICAVTFNMFNVIVFRDTNELDVVPCVAPASVDELENIEGKVNL